MNQQKTGEFLKHLRKSKGMTQEQLAEHFYISSRTVSRWETGSNMPDLDMLIDLADFYDVDIREIIDGERKSEIMNDETRDTLKKVAEYAAEEKKKLQNKLTTTLGIAAIVLLCCSVLFRKETQGLLYGIVPEPICTAIRLAVSVVAVVMIVSYCLYLKGVFDKLLERKMRDRKSSR